MSVNDAVRAYQDAVKAESRLREQRDAAKADASRLAEQLADAAEHRHALRVNLDEILRDADE